MTGAPPSEVLGVRPSPPAAGEIHLWWCREETDGFDRPEWLTAAERTRGARYRFEPLRRGFRVRQGFLRALLGSYLDRAPAEVCFTEGERGKPYLAGRDRERLSFNLSYSEGWILVGVAAGVELGVDVQHHLSLAADLEPMARQVMTPSEHAAYLAAPEAERAARFYRLWARKEAVLKASGLGLYREPDTFAVGHDRLDGEAVRAPAADAWDGPLAVRDLAAPPDFSAALAAGLAHWRTRVLHGFAP